MDERFQFSIGRVTRFYVPLLVQAFSQSLSYPLVAGIVTHGAFGVHALTAFNQGLMIMFMIGALGGGLVTTGLVFAKTYYGYMSYKRLTMLMMGGLLALQCIPAIPPFDRLIFEGFFALPSDLAAIARDMLVLGVVMNAGFFFRNVPMVVLFNNLESGKANNATLLRIAATLGLSVAFPRFGLNGPYWGLAALTVGVWIEFAVTWLYARPFVRRMRPYEMAGQPVTPTRAEVVALLFEQFRFTMPLALGGFLISASPLLLSAFVARTANPADMLAIHYVTLGVANPVAYAALRMQPVAVQFRPAREGDRRLLWYAIVAGLLLGLVMLLFATPAVGNWYFGIYQNMPPRLLGTTRLVIGIYAGIAVIHAVRGRIEGIAAAAKCSSAVMAGQIAYTVALVAVCLMLLPFDVPGCLLAQAAIFIAPICTTVAVYAVYARHRRISMSCPE